MQDTAIYYIALHSINEDDYDCATTHLYLKGKEAYDLMLKFIDETNPMKPKLIRKDFGHCETGPLSL